MNLFMALLTIFVSVGATAGSIGTFFTSGSTSSSHSKISGYFSNIEFKDRESFSLIKNQKLNIFSPEFIKVEYNRCQERLKENWNVPTVQRCAVLDSMSRSKTDIETAANTISSANLEILSGINDIANEAWDRLLDCAQGNVDRARKYYYDNNFNCENPELSKKLAATIKDLHVQLNNFLLTSNIAVFNRYYNYQEFATVIFNSNPLLTQSLIEFLATIVRFQEDPFVLEAHIGQRHWIEYHYSNQFEARVNVVINSGNSNDLKFNLAKSFKNSILLANLLLDNYDGHTWGLWPEAGRVLSFAISRQSYSVSTPLMAGMRDLSCRSDKVHSWRGLMGKDLITEYRKMAASYGYQTEHRHRCFWNLDGGLILVGAMNYCVATDPWSPDDIEIMFNPARRSERLSF